MLFNDRTRFGGTNLVAAAISVGALAGATAWGGGAAIHWVNVIPEQDGIPNVITLRKICPLGSAPCTWSSADARVTFTAQSGDGEYLRTVSYTVTDQNGALIGQNRTVWANDSETTFHSETMEGSPGGANLHVPCRRTASRHFKVSTDTRFLNSDQGTVRVERALTMNFTCEEPPAEEDFSVGGDITTLLARPLTQLAYVHFSLANGHGADRTFALEVFSEDGSPVALLGDGLLTLDAGGSASVWAAVSVTLHDAALPPVPVHLVAIDLESGALGLGSALVRAAPVRRQSCATVAPPVDLDAEFLLLAGVRPGSSISPVAVSPYAFAGQTVCPPTPSLTASCLEPTHQIGCADPLCSSSVCSVDPYCCAAQWDATCTMWAWEFCVVWE